MIDVCINNRSGWIIELIESQYINISTYRPLLGSSYMDLPVESRSPRKGLINIKNKDKKMFFMVSWKVSFNPNPSKQAQEAIFSRKTKKKYHSPLAFNNNNVLETNSQKRVGVVLDNRLSFEDHLKMTLNKVNKTIGLLQKLHNILPRSALLIIYKSFIRPHLDYSDIIYDQAYNASFHQKLELFSTMLVSQ